MEKCLEAYVCKQRNVQRNLNQTSLFSSITNVITFFLIIKLHDKAQSTGLPHLPIIGLCSWSPNTK